ncbi:MAG TPA: SDR family oxidoreductase [Verrucomicrobiae bacterium]|nr:SDR family oxidoreductase [Verrucomicrobiae bacterium]
MTKKWVLISGGNGVLGQSYARALKEDGYSVLSLDGRETPNSSTNAADEWFKCDITEKDDIAKLAERLPSLGGQIYGLINNASCQPEGFGKELEDYSVDTFRKVLDVNLAGSFLLTKLVIPHMKQARAGSVVNIGSIQGVVAPTFAIYEGMSITSPLVYSVAKAGLIHFSKWVAAKYGPFNIRCNAVSPGGVGDSQKGGSTFADIYASRTPLRRMARSSDIAEVVRFLISPKADYVTGQNLVVDGGWTIY